MDPSGIIAILLSAGSVVSAFVTVLFHSMSLSRCKNIDCCCIKCDREVLSEETYKAQQVIAREVEQNND